MKQQIESAYKQLIKAGKNPEFLNQAVIELMEKPEIIDEYKGDITKTLKAMSKTIAERMKWRKRQDIQRFTFFEAEKRDEKTGENVKLEIVDNSAVYDIERVEMIKHVISLLSKDETKQKIFCLYYIEKQTVREIAETLSLSKSDVDRKLKNIANTIDKANIRRLYADAYLMATEKPAGMEKIRMQQKHNTSPAFDRLIDITDADAMEVYQAEKKTAAKATRKAAKKAAKAAYRHVSDVALLKMNPLLKEKVYRQIKRLFENEETAYIEFIASENVKKPGRQPQSYNDGTIKAIQGQYIDFTLIDSCKEFMNVYRMLMHAHKTSNRLLAYNP